MVPIDRQIQQRMAAAGNSPDRAMQTFRRKGDVLDLMVLEQLVSERKQANMDNMRRQGIDPTTVFDQKMTEALSMVQGKNPDEGRSINEVAARTRDTLNQQQNIANARARQAGVTQPPKMGSAGGVMKMAGGGIVGYKTGQTVYAGGVTQADVDRFKLTGGAAGSFAGLTDTQIAQIIAKARGKNVQPDVTVAQAMNKQTGQTLSTQAPQNLQVPKTDDLSDVPSYSPKTQSNINKALTKAVSGAAVDISDDPFAQMNPKKVE